MAGLFNEGSLNIMRNIVSIIKPRTLWKTVLIIAMLSTMIILLSGCTASGKTPSKNPPVKEIWADINQSVSMPQMSELDGKKFQRLYGIDPDDVAEFSVFVSASNIKADEVAIIKVKDQKDVEDIINKINERINKQETSFKDYLPDEYYIIKNHVLKSQGDYLLLSISKDADKIEEIFDSFFK